MAAELTWKRSTYSASGDGNCVECAGDGHVVLIRDSKCRDGQRLEVSSASWRAFVLLARS
ncbi:DUF397 domain-containing protein [Lentzea sp. HUAS TT2]|uniref:DUF397 domain-containing protein n=1 Tax=Lentzea sp. HUAS TT2 TaxID=3447454 RepID=UPI003F71D890